MLNLAIGLGVIGRSPIHPNSPGVVEVQEFVTYELGAIISNNATGNSKPVDNVLDEFNCLLQLEVDDGSDFKPLGELIDGN